jgi:hypothetical protein
VSQAADSELDFDRQVKHSGEKLGDPPDQPGWSEQSIEPVTVIQPSFSDPPLPYLRLLHAEPLMPMQERDWAAIRDLFEQGDIEAIEADIVQNLANYRPELHWDDWDALICRDSLPRF